MISSLINQLETKQLETLKRLAKGAARRLRLVKPTFVPFRGAYATYQEAIASVRKGALAGYDNDAVADVGFDVMCTLELWDYPVLFWLQRLIAETHCVLDAGGHVGTKYRAFHKHLELDRAPISWVIYDVPSIVRAGRERAQKDGLRALLFVDSLSEVTDADVFLASGLLQYLDIPFPELLRRLPKLPRHLVLNKVATREGPTVVTLQNLGCAEVPYQMRNRAEFLASLALFGYEVVDEWTIAAYSHVIPSHPKLGASTSRGYYMTLRT